MHWRQTGVALAVVVAAGVVVVPTAPTASAATGWQATVLPLPDGARGGWVTGTDGVGNYSGTYYDMGGTGPTMAIWPSGGDVVSVAPPEGCTEVTTVGENTVGVIAVEAGGCGDASANLPYVYSDGGYRALALPAGYTGARTDAITTRGDVLGSASGQPGEATVVWPADSSEPVVIPDTLPGQQASDLDDDGETVLFQTDDGPFLWHDGTMTEVAVPRGWDAAWGGAVCGGVVAGATSRGSGTETYAVTWPTPAQPVTLQAGSGTQARACNASGLVAGGLMTWRGAGSAGSLPLPPGYDTGSAFTVGEDDSVAGVVTYYGDAREYDDPVVWRWS